MPNPVAMMDDPQVPIPMLIWCPVCNNRHIDTGEFETKSHHTHACQHCGMVWRPAIVPTKGVQFLPGFKNDTTKHFLGKEGPTGATGPGPCPAGPPGPIGEEGK